VSKRYDDMATWGRSWPWHNTYDYPDIDDSDEKIERFVEEQRQEYYDAWFEYVSEFE